MRKLPNCQDCGKKLSDCRSLYCQKCSGIKRQKHRFCSDCGIEILLDSIRCRPCSDKNKRIIRPLRYCKGCNELITHQSKSGLCTSCISTKKYGKPNLYWLGKSNKDVIIKHHVDGNKKNNKESNFLKIAQGEHRSLHWNGYKFLVRINLIKEYLSDFTTKNGMESDRRNCTVVHHIDCKHSNNDENNFMYLKDRKIHNKLHQEAYNYLVGIDKINDYLKWFFLGRRKITNQLRAIEELNNRNPLEIKEI